MKKRLVLVILILLGIFSCAKLGPITFPSGTITIEAQSLPITRTLAWDAATNADGYNVTQDGVAIGSPTILTQPITIATLGSHTFTVVAFNIWGSSSPASLTVNVVIPGNSSNLKIR